MLKHQLEEFKNFKKVFENSYELIECYYEFNEKIPFNNVTVWSTCPKDEQISFMKIFREIEELEQEQKEVILDKIVDLIKLKDEKLILEEISDKESNPEVEQELEK